MLRKTLYGTLAVSLLFVSASTANAQFANPIRFNVHAGASLPMSDFGDTDFGGADLGFRVGAGLELRPALAPVGLRLDGAYDRMGIEDADAAYSIWNVTANGVFSPMASPLYFIGGIGFYGADLSGDDIDFLFGDLESETNFGFNIGVGFALPLTGFSTFIEARWHRFNIDGGGDIASATGMDHVDYIPVVFGIRF